MRLKKHTILLSFFVGMLFVSCSKEDDVPAPPTEKEQTLFIYMAADNSLGTAYNKFDYSNIASLLNMVKPSHLAAANIIIYHDPKITSDDRTDNKPRLLEIVIGADGKATTKEARVYNEQNSGTAAVFNQVMTEALRAYPAKKYGLVMWSHGSGWLPGDFSSDYFSVRAIGQDDRNGSSFIEIDEFADAIPDGQFEYIAFDACYMGYIEVAYALRNKTNYILASTVEIMGPGMIYDQMPNFLLRKTPEYNRFCDAFYDRYNENYGCTISLIKTEGLDALAGTVNEILKEADVETDIIKGISSVGLQRFGQNIYENVFFDLDEFMEKLASGSQYAEFRSAMDEIVVYNRYSETIKVSASWNDFDIKKHSGLGCYIPRNYEKLNDYYSTTEWYKVVYPDVTLP